MSEKMNGEENKKKGHVDAGVFRSRSIAIEAKREQYKIQDTFIL